MYPLFEYDMDHVYHAFNLLNDNGILVAIVSRVAFSAPTKKNLNSENLLIITGISSIYQIPFQDLNLLSKRELNPI